MKYIVALILLLVVAVGGWQLYEWRNQPPEVTFARATQGTIASEVSTNGRVDPIESAEARSETSGRVDRILISLRQQVKVGDPLVELDTSLQRQELETIGAQIQEVRTQLAVIDAGGRQPEKVALQSEIDQLQVELAAAQRTYVQDQNLAAKGAIPREQATISKNRVDSLQAQIAGRRSRMNTLVDQTDRGPLDARIRQLESQREGVQLRIAQSTVRSPLTGTVFQFDLKPGAYLNPGDVVATIGRLDRVKVLVYVDEPDLGRVQRNQPVTITWDAQPGRQWTGVVDRLPTKIQPLDSRQVGEVTCIIDNPNLDLLPGANATVRIRTDLVENAVSIPKEAIFRENGKAGVYLLAGEHLEWREITQGVTNITRVQVSELKAGDAVALPGDRSLSNRMLITPRMLEER